MVPSGSNRRRASQPGGKVALTVEVGAPGRHGAVGLESQTVRAPTGHRHHPSEVGRRASLVLRVIAPGRDGAIPLDRQAVIFSGSDGDYAGQARWHNGLPGEMSLGVGVVTPSEKRAVGSEGETV